MKKFKIFLASPSDTNEERKVANEVIEEINKSLGSRDNFFLELLKWETDTYSSVGEDGQDVVNKQIGNDYNIFVGIMWKKFGSPTQRAESGTEEEFNLAYKRLEEGSNVHIMFYFNSSLLPQDSDIEQWKKVCEFKEKIQTKGIYHKSFENTNGFEKTLRMDLTRYVKDILKEQGEENKVNANGVNPCQQITNPEIRDAFSEYINDIGVRFAHSKIDNLRLNDIYIAPDLKYIDSSKKREKVRVINLDLLTDAIDVDDMKYVLLGDDSAGKTVNCKYLFQKYFDQGFFPILLSGLDFGTNNVGKQHIRSIVEKKIKEQYKDGFKLSDIDLSEVILIIDDFHKSTKGKNKYLPLLMRSLELLFNRIIVTGNTLMPIENINKYDPFENFQMFSILEFGPIFRHELVNKWNTIGIQSQYFDPNVIRRKNDDYIAHIKSIIGKSYIPSYPFYILSILQSLESGNVQNPNYSIHGFYYEVLINECFNKAIKDNKEISLYYNYLTQLCFHLFEIGVKEMTFEQFDAFHEMYCKNHDLTYSKEAILETFDSAKLLSINGRIYIKEKYVYYFFVAKYIANEISNKQEIKNLVSKMAKRLFHDEYASIIMFVTHLSKDSFIINELIDNANSFFKDSNTAKLQDDINEINNLVESIPSQVLDIIEVDAQRDKELLEQERLEALEKELEEEPLDYGSVNLDDDISTIDFFARITRALKTIDILGQIAKKHWGELDGVQKMNIVKSTYEVGLRTLDFYLQLLQRNSKEIVEHVRQLIEKKHFKDRHSLKKGIEETARDFIFRLCYISSFGIIRRVSNAIGYDKLNNTFERVLNDLPYNSVQLIDLATKLGYSSISTHLDTIDKYQNKMEKNKLSSLVLSSLVIDYLYMFDTDYRTRNRLCSKLGINIQEIRRIDKTSKIKRK